MLSLVFLAATLPSQAESSFFRHLEQSAGRGTAESQFILGLAYRDGWQGTVKSGSAAAKWYDLAAELGDKRPLLVFGLLQKGEDRVEKNEATALKWLNLAADSGDNYACVILGEMLLEGNGVPADWKRGTEWIRKSAQTGFAPAQARLGIICLVGDESTPKDEIEALAWFIVAAESGSRAAQAYRDQRAHLLGPEAFRLAMERTRTLVAKPVPGAPVLSRSAAAVRR